MRSPNTSTAEAHRLRSDRRFNHVQWACAVLAVISIVILIVI
jgi:hypothetical protein